ncbi:hypothetical protein SIN8267_01911 [Sinobacterium norvegicum]|uniref:Transcriptional regulator SutA RNAP-binding domain-containing protein n=1 Tax=Sinobacterium norvegicum TaxID=1641715 RepID=A0ABN8ENR2_9GAMM|nr:hypothetical protein [Sinobacterium norvegicum]CAH0991796.1 hypothetical protein SIN8267_01911 [Sinobacterium norvegicum]
MAVKTKSAKKAPKPAAGNELVDVDMDFIGSTEEYARARTIDSRRRIRQTMDDDIEAFISAGGCINHIAPNVTADPPKKPGNSYGGRSI